MHMICPLENEYLKSKRKLWFYYDLKRADCSGARNHKIGYACVLPATSLRRLRFHSERNLNINRKCKRWGDQPGLAWPRLGQGAVGCIENVKMCGKCVENLKMWIFSTKFVWISSNAVLAVSARFSRGDHG